MDGGQMPGLLQEQQAPSQGALAGELLLDADREHLQAHLAGAQLRQPELAERVLVAPLTLVADGQEKVEMTVGDAHAGASHPEAVARWRSSSSTRAW
jgi:hypothetical protein